MTIATWIKGAGIRQLLILSKFFFFHPLLIVPTFRATRKTVAVCNRNFGKKHHRNNAANAFRHALWNILICQECYGVSGSVEKVMRRAEEITNLHEMIAPNSEAARKMDLHNNHIGRKLYKKYASTEMDFLPVLKKMMEDAVKVNTMDDIERAHNTLVYIEN